MDVSSSKKPILFVGSAHSDVHFLCSEGVRSQYQRIDTGDAKGCFAALERLADFVEATKRGHRNSNEMLNEG